MYFWYSAHDFILNLKSFKKTGLRVCENFPKILNVISSIYSDWSATTWRFNVATPCRHPWTGAKVINSVRFPSVFSMSASPFPVVYFALLKSVEIYVEGASNGRHKTEHPGLYQLWGFITVWGVACAKGHKDYEKQVFRVSRVRPTLFKAGRMIDLNESGFWTIPGMKWVEKKFFFR